jgi:hypothetical protein
MTSLTGISSGRVTRATWQRAGSDSKSTTSAAWVRIGPPRAASRRPPADDRNVMVWPVAGASTSTRSATPLRSICLTFPSTRTSLMPGMAPDTRSTIPDDISRLDTRRRPWSAKYSMRASSGVMVRARTVPAGMAVVASGSAPRRRWHRPPPVPIRHSPRGSSLPKAATGRCGPRARLPAPKAQRGRPNGQGRRPWSSCQRHLCRPRSGPGSGYRKR